MSNINKMTLSDNIILLMVETGFGVAKCWLAMKVWNSRLVQLHEGLPTVGFLEFIIFMWFFNALVTRQVVKAEEQDVLTEALALVVGRFIGFVLVLGMVVIMTTWL